MIWLIQHEKMRAGGDRVKAESHYAFLQHTPPAVPGRLYCGGILSPTSSPSVTVMVSVIGSRPAPMGSARN